jgi:hypothetical protein
MPSPCLTLKGGKKKSVGMGERTKDGTGQPEPMVSTLIGAESAEHCEGLPPLAFRLGSIVPAHKQSTLRCFKNSLGLIYF